ncbi:UNVERIFIED_CONTAM: Squamosa promoter-binding-like protein 3 [Sesamum latifolium]|uniref:Squamosa promoter-binding-like protein 3 n=1 Tax=Sesamum latifolium TaxID=2727402 RepID=A0AAW2UWE7_9LAMI
MLVDDGEIHTGSFNLSGCGGGNSGASSSDGGHGSSAKSSISASTDSSTRDGMQTPNFMFSNLRALLGILARKWKSKELKFLQLPAPEASIGSMEPLIGLKLGKRTYFENSGGGSNVKSTSFSVMPTPSPSMLKKTKSSGQNAPVRCQVEGCKH